MVQTIYLSKKIDNFLKERDFFVKRVQTPAFLDFKIIDHGDGIKDLVQESFVVSSYLFPSFEDFKNFFKHPQKVFIFCDTDDMPIIFNTDQNDINKLNGFIVRMKIIELNKRVKL